MELFCTTWCRKIVQQISARKTFSLEDYSEVMDGIFTTSVSVDTIDACPMAFKPIETILKIISTTLEVVEIILPVYNFKEGE